MHLEIAFPYLLPDLLETSVRAGTLSLSSVWWVLCRHILNEKKRMVSPRLSYEK